MMRDTSSLSTSIGVKEWRKETGEMGLVYSATLAAFLYLRASPRIERRLGVEEIARPCARHAALSGALFPCHVQCVGVYRRGKNKSISLNLVISGGTFYICLCRVYAERSIFAAR